MPKVESLHISVERSLNNEVESIAVPITNRFIRKFYQTPFLLFLVFLLYKVSSLVFGYERLVGIVTHYGGWFRWGITSVIVFIPELATLLTLQVLLTAYHRALRLSEVVLTFRGIIKYYLILLPLLLLSFFLISPFTQTVRFFVEVPYTLLFFSHIKTSFSFSCYLNDYLIGPYLRPKIVGSYVIFLPILGYLIVTISLIQDILNRPGRPDTLVKEIDTSGYPQHITGYSAKGESVLPVSEIGLIAINARDYLAYHLSGVYEIRIKALTELEDKLDPSVFFRINRGCLVNRAFVDAYSHMENNRYIVNLKVPFQVHSQSLSRPRLTHFRQWYSVERKK